MKKVIGRIKRKKGFLYCIDKNGFILEVLLNKGTTKKMVEKKKKRKEERYF